jgi:membrane dipeptidase
MLWPLHGSRTCALLACVVVAALATLPRLARSQPGTPSRYDIVDLHVDLPYQMQWKGHDLARSSGQYAASWLLAAGVRRVVFPLFVPQHASREGPRMRHLEDAYLALQSKLPGTAPYTAVPCSGEAAGVDTFYAFEGSAPLGRDLDSVFRWARRGVRLYGLVHTNSNALASTAGPGPRPRAQRLGLSALGRELVRRVHATSGILDVSHASDPTFADVLVQATADDRPLVATHSNARALAPHARNLTDAQLRAIAQRGGVVGVTFHSPFLLGSSGRARPSDVVRHIRHLVSVADIDAAAIGSDFEGGIVPPTELLDARGFPKLAQALLADGFSDAEVRKILSGNARRLLCGG